MLITSHEKLMYDFNMVVDSDQFNSTMNIYYAEDGGRGMANTSTNPQTAATVAPPTGHAEQHHGNNNYKQTAESEQNMQMQPSR
jgi:hypothetical protein